MRNPKEPKLLHVSRSSITRTDEPLSVSAYTATSAIGRGLASIQKALRERRSGLRINDFGDEQVSTFIGRCEGIENEPLPPNLEKWECRNNRLAWIGLTQDGFLDAVSVARKRYGANRIAVILGTSTSSIGASEEGYRRIGPDGRFPSDLRRAIVHTPHSTGHFVQQALGLTGLSVTVATACSSSAKAFPQAERLIRLGLADAAVVGGVDTLCGSVLFGFNSLELLSRNPCRPFDAARDGINLGEAAGFALIERSGNGPQLRGYGESSDAYHMTSPHHDGVGALRAINEALARGGITAAEVDYINLHGTASIKNDEIEAAVVADLFPAHTFASSTKGWTGHTLGASGILEAVITLTALESGLVPGTLNTIELDSLCGPQIKISNIESYLRFGLSSSFGFGGSNCVLLFERKSTS